MDYFDESIFYNNDYFKDYDIVACTNKADEFLIRKHGKTPSKPCNLNSKVSINPLLSCFGINLYTMNVGGKQVLNTCKFNKLYVSEQKSTNLLQILEYNKLENENDNFIAHDVVYGYNKELTPMESSIMLKYYTRFSNIYITIELYLYVKNQFKDGKNWFIVPYLGVIKDQNNELYENDSLLDIYKLELTDKAIDF